MVEVSKHYFLHQSNGLYFVLQIRDGSNSTSDGLRFFHLKGSIVPLFKYSSKSSMPLLAIVKLVDCQPFLKQLLPLLNISVTQLSKKLDISKNTIYTWRKVARKKGELIPNSNPDRIRKWRKEYKLKIVIETFSMNEIELSKYVECIVSILLI